MQSGEIECNEETLDFSSYYNVVQSLSDKENEMIEELLKEKIPWLNSNQIAIGLEDFNKDEFAPWIDKDPNNIDLVVTNHTPYTPDNPALNRLSGHFAQINIGCNSAVHLRVRTMRSCSSGKSWPKLLALWKLDPLRTAESSPLGRGINPRLLVFEFTHDLLLREAQVTLPPATPAALLTC